MCDACVHSNCFRHTLIRYVLKVKHTQSRGRARKRERRSLIHKLGARNQWNKMSIQSAHFRRDINHVRVQEGFRWAS